MKCFYNTRNAIPNIQNIEIINTFWDGVSDIKTVEEITMKKLKMVLDLLVVADMCIKASEARAWLLESHNKGPSKRSGKKIRRSTQRIVGIVSSSPLSKRKIYCSIDLPMQRSGAKSTTSQGMI